LLSASCIVQHQDRIARLFDVHVPKSSHAQQQSSHGAGRST
jgi:hypothetical protein